jgi:hypothetical protein
MTESEYDLPETFPWFHLSTRDRRLSKNKSVASWCRSATETLNREINQIVFDALRPRIQSLVNYRLGLSQNWNHWGPPNAACVCSGDRYFIGPRTWGPWWGI